MTTRSAYRRIADYFLKFLAAVAVFLPVNMDCPLLFQTVLVLLYVAALLLITRKNITMDWLSDTLQPLPDTAKGPVALSWPFLGAYLLCAMLAFLEWTQPFYFTQDDNHTQFLPVVIQAMRGFFSEGVFPTWNAFLDQGHHTASVAVYTLTYPVTYIAYLIARFLTGSDLHHIEVFAWIHFFAGYCILYAALRAACVRPLIATTGALCFVLCGFNLVAGRSWMIAQPYITWLPALAWSVVVFERAALVSVRWVVFTGFTIGIAFHAGHAQLWFYGVLFWGISIVWLIYCKPGVRWAGFLSACSAGFMGLAIAAPLLLVQALEEIGLTNLRWDYGIGLGLNNLLLPFPVMNAGHPNRWGIHEDYMGALYYSGSLFFILFMIKCVCEVVYVIKHQNASRPFALTTLTFSIPLMMVFWWSLGQEGHLWMWLSYIPPLDNMNSPFKFLPFIALYSVMVSAPFLERLIRNFRLAGHYQCAIAGITLGLIGINGVSGKYPWMDMHDRPYPPLPPEMRKLQVPHGFTDKALRVMPYSPWRSQTPNYTITLPHNYPSYYRILSTDGYNLAVTGTLEQRKNKNWRGKSYYTYLNEFGIRGALLAHQNANESLADDRIIEVELLKKFVQKPIVINNAGDKYYPINSNNIKPIVFASILGKVISLPFRIRPDGIEVKIPNELQTEILITANFVYRRWFRAADADGNVLPIAADKMGRIITKNTGSSRLITIRYLPPWWVGSVIGFVLASLSWGAWRFARRCSAR